MKIRNIFFIALASMALIACGSEEKSKSQPEPIIPIDEETMQPDVEGIDTTEEKQEIVEFVLDGDSSKPGYIVISKESMTLTLYDVNGKGIYRFPVAVGKNLGNKKKKGDMKTPEGKFTIHQIQPASSWSHDFKDGKGQIPHAYGDWFIRLMTPPHTGIGIHGTHAPESIGTRATEGCIRLHNENLNKLKPLVKVGMEVTIETSVADMEADGKSSEEIEAAQASANEGIELRPVTEEGKATTETKPAEEKTVSDIKPSTETKPMDIKPEESKAAAEAPKTEYAEGEIIEHTVESGQFISHIAVKYHTTTAKILELNEGLDPAKIRPGQKIKVQPNTDGKSTKATAPAATVVESADGTYHTIVSGDMLGKIARTYGTTVAEIERLNPGINSTNLQIGQKVRVK